LVPVLLVIGYFVFFKDAAVADSTLKATVKKGDFVISVTATGELKPVNSVAIKGPTNLRDYNIYQIKIQDLIPEGTIVKKGDFVAELERSEVTTKLMERQNDLAKYEAQILQARLDTTLTLRQARDEINNLVYELKNKELILQQSKYEPPATIKQAELDLEKGVRSLKQARENYLIKRRQAHAKIDEIATSLTSSQIKLKGIMELMGMLTITATEPGMVIYERSWGGEKIKTGSQISV
jgi:multidrug efflux pump subunit AcrA (membrane-fusion protein)